MTATRLLALGECLGRPAREVGRKAAMLAWAQDAGLSTPGGLVAPSDAFWTALEACGGAGQARYLAESALRLDPQHTLDIAASLYAALSGGEVARLAGPIAEAAFDELNATPLVCRSSSALEDGKTASFPGVFVSVLGLESAEALAAALVACWRSAFAPAAIRYLLRMGVDAIDFSMAALIQPQVAAAWYGLYVSADPLSGRHEPQIELTDLGPEALVHGAAATLAVERRDGHWSSLDPRLGQLAGALDRTALAAERLSIHLGRDVDVEFALPRDAAAPIILQARPLTRARIARLSGAETPEGSAQHGRGCAAGRVSGVLSAPSPGAEAGTPRIAVVGSLTPQDYAVVFDHAGVVMTQDTSPLGHVAILCRELGVPLICGLPDAGKLIGRWAVIDGRTGDLQPVRAHDAAAPRPAPGVLAEPLDLTDIELDLRWRVEGRPCVGRASEIARIAASAARRLGARSVREIPVQMPNPPSLRLRGRGNATRPSTPRD